MFLCFTGSGRTLREGPLESSPVMKILKKYFASSWVLVHELRAGTNDSSSLSDEMKQKYRRTLDTYRYILILKKKPLTDYFGKHFSF